MVYGAAIRHAVRFKDLLVRPRSEKLAAELMPDMKTKLLENLSRRTGKGISAQLNQRQYYISMWGFTEGDNGFLMYVFNTRKLPAVRDVIIQKLEIV